jgi:hypothetical protein
MRRMLTYCALRYSQPDTMCCMLHFCQTAINAV